MTSQDLSEALADCQQAIKLEPDNSEAYLLLDDYATAITTDPKNAMAYNNRGVAPHSLKDYRGALADHNIAIELAPTNALHDFNRGETLFLQGQRDLACSSFRQGQALKPDFELISPDFDATYLKA